MKYFLSFLTLVSGAVIPGLVLIGVAGCVKSKTPNSTDLGEKVKGTWVQESKVCGTSVTSYSAIENKVVFDNATYTITAVMSGCTVTKTGNWSSSNGVLSMSYSAVACSPSSCSAIYRENDNPTTLNCPGDVKTDGNNYAASVDSSTLYLTPTLGQETSCYYKYRKQ